MLRLMQLNAENLFLYFDQPKPSDISSISEHEWQKLSTSVVDNKPLGKARALAKTIEAGSPDIITLNEVGGLESLMNFNEMFLQGKYTPQLVEGNSDRGIDVCFLVRSEIPYKFHLFSHRRRSINFHYPHEAEDTRHFMSRDVAELHMFSDDSSKPALICLLVHLKSKLDRENIDPGGCLRREAELRVLVDVYNETREKYSSSVPVIVSGDFNGRARKTAPDNEFLPLHQDTDLIELLDIVEAEEADRVTQIQFPDHWNQIRRQLDYIFVSPDLREFVDKENSGVLPFIDERGDPIPPPNSLDQRLSLPSDHYPVLLTVNKSF